MKMGNFNKRKFASLSSVLTLIVGVLFISSCNDDDDTMVDPGDVTAAFTSSADGLTLTFVNASTNATDYMWDFGDGNSSTDENPAHTYTDAGSYEVTLTASNSANTANVTNTAITLNGGPLASKIVGKEWIAARGEVFCYSQGDIGSETFTEFGGGNFGWGDVPGGWALLSARPALANDEYTFNVDGSYSVNFNGDLWAEYSMWDEFGEFAITIADGVPNSYNGDDMSAFANPNDDWTFVVDETEATIAVSGMGAHILNPRMANTSAGTAVLTPQSSVWYDIVRVVEVEGAADTLVLYAEVSDLGSSGFGHYIKLHAYEDEAVIPGFYEAPDHFETTVASSTISHDFLSVEGTGAGIYSIDGPYTAEYGVEVGGATAAKLTRPIGDQWGNYFMRAGTAGGDRSEIDFSGGETVVEFDVYLPSSNDYSAELANIVRVRFFDESRLGGNFWQEYIQLEEADLAEDTWVSLSFDFTSLLSEAAANNNVPDGVFIEFSEVGTVTTSEAVMYVKNFRFTAP